LEDLSKFSWFNVINLRYFNPIWAHISWDIWENSEWIPNNLLPFVMKVAKWELEKLNIFWDDYDTIDWTWIRDYIDVVDLIEGHLKAYELIENLEFNWFSDNYNLWTWKWVSVLEIIKKTEKITWKKINYEIVDRREWDLWEVYCNPSKANNILWWKAEISLDESLENSWRFYNN
jgi:UDP-glucose 4-epimerase